MNFESQPEHSGNSFLRKKFKELPVFFPPDYKNSNAVGIVRAYKLHIGQRIFMTFKDQRGSKLGMLIRMLTKVAIIVNAAAYVWSWSPVNMITSTTCDDPVCNNDSNLCPGEMICEPYLDVRMLNIQIMCMLVLLGNFMIPTLFCWSVPARLAGVLDLTLEMHMADEASNKFDSDEDERTGVFTRKRSSSAARHVKQYIGISTATSGMTAADIDKLEVDLREDPKYPVVMQVCRYITTGRSLRAIVGNVPLFMVFLTVPNLKSGGLLVYIARMTPLLQLVDFISGKKSGQVTRRTLARAYPTMLFMIWCIFLLAVVVGAVVFLLERGEFTVTEDFPDGAFLRPTVTGRGKEESPFTSMALSLYWVVVTVTSVGYGEMVCTSAYGRLISVMLMILSIFVLALPIAVIGQILTEEMENYVERKAQKETRVAEQIGVDKSSDLLKKYSSAIERRKSQFKFDLPNELKLATERRKNMMVKMHSANDVLQSTTSSSDASKSTTPILKRRSVSFNDEKSPTNVNYRSSTSKLFNSWSEADEDEDEGSDRDDSDSDSDSDGEGPPKLIRRDSDDGVGEVGESRMVEQKENEDSQESGFVLGSPIRTSPSPSPRSTKHKVRIKAEAEWDRVENEKTKEYENKKINAHISISNKGPVIEMPLSASTRTPSPKNLNRKNPMLRPTTAKRMGSDPLLFKKKTSPSPTSRGIIRSPSARIRDIDRELRLLESNYFRQMQQCTDTHNQIVALMKEKNDSLNEALL